MAAMFHRLMSVLMLPGGSGKLHDVL